VVLGNIPWKSIMATVTTKGILKTSGKILGVIILFCAFAFLALSLIPTLFNLFFITGITAIMVIAISYSKEAE
jgi:hypothetical protein